MPTVVNKQKWFPLAQLRNFDVDRLHDAKCAAELKEAGMEDRIQPLEVEGVDFASATEVQKIILQFQAEDKFLREWEKRDSGEGFHSKK